MCVLRALLLQHNKQTSGLLKEKSSARFDKHAELFIFQAIFLYRGLTGLCKTVYRSSLVVEDLENRIKLGYSH